MNNYSGWEILLLLAMVITLVNQARIYLVSNAQPLWHVVNAAVTASAAGAVLLHLQWAALLALLAIVMQAGRSACTLSHFRHGVRKPSPDA